MIVWFVLSFVFERCSSKIINHTICFCFEHSLLTIDVLIKICQYKSPLLIAYHCLPIQTLTILNFYRKATGQKFFYVTEKRLYVLSFIGMGNDNGSIRDGFIVLFSYINLLYHSTIIISIVLQKSFALSKWMYEQQRNMQPTRW